MKILLVHNKYSQYGGEDAVFQTEGDLLVQHGQEVDRLIFKSPEKGSFIEKCLIAFRTFYNPMSARLLKEKIEKFKPDVIHVHNFFPIASPSIFFVAKKLGIPVVMTLHNYRLISPNALLYYNHQIYERGIKEVFALDAILKGVYRNSILQTAVIASMTAFHNIIGTWKNRVNKYIVLTQFSREKFRSSALKIAEEQLLIKPNFVMDFGPSDEQRSDFFLFIGRLSEEKGIETLLKATRLHDFKLLILGDGPLRSMVEDYARRNPNIEFRGFQDQPSIIHALKTCRALIFPSMWYEGFPITILQAFSTGTPVIASKLGGMKEVVTDKINGLHFEAGNEADLVMKIREIIRLPKETEVMSANARKTYLDNYTPEINYRQLTEIYSEVLGKIDNELVTQVA